MVQRVQATYRDGVLEPSESLDLEEGDVVTLSISVEGGSEDGETAESELVNGNGEVVGANKEPDEKSAPSSILEMIRKIHESVPDSEWEKLPKDGARNLKHYLYGWPKEEER